MNKAVSPAQTIYPALSDAIVKSAFALVVTVVLASRLLVNKRALTALKADFSWLKLVVSSLVEAVTVFSELEESVFSELDVLLELVFAEEDELLEVLVELFEVLGTGQSAEAGIHAHTSGLDLKSALHGNRAEKQKVRIGSGISRKDSTEFRIRDTVTDISPGKHI